MEQNIIDLQVSSEELSVIFTCLIGSSSCPPKYKDLVNRFYVLCKEYDIYPLNAYCK